MDKQQGTTKEYYGKEDLKEIFNRLLKQKFLKEISEGRDNDEK